MRLRFAALPAPAQFMSHLTLRNSKRARRRHFGLPRLFAVVHIIFGGIAFGQDKPVSIETIERAKRATVPIVCIVVNSDGSVKLNGTVGSAFFINDEGYFMTAAHVVAALEVRNKDKQACTAPAIYVPRGGWEVSQLKHEFQWFTFTDCLQNAQRDVAVCRPVQNPFQNPIVKKEIRFMTFSVPSVQSDGMPVAFTGFPLGFTRPVTSKGYIASYLPSEQFIMIDKTAWPGASGSPLYLADGTVTGIVLRTGKDEGSGLAYSCPVSVITDFLSTNKIAFQQQKQKS